jgi:ATP-dependent RNA helicase UAP56/SUB2
MNLLDKVVFDQGVIFVNTVERAKKLTNLLIQKLFASICMHSGLTQEERIKNFDKFKKNQARFLLATDLFGRGIDI